MARTYTMTVGAVIGQARLILADKRSDMELRTSDTELIDCLNEALNAMVGIVPGLFSTQETHACVAGYLQQLEFDRASVFMEVLGLPECDSVTLSQFAPGWMSATAGAPENWMRVPGDQLRFMVYPPAAATSPLTVRYAKSPATLTATGNVIPIPEHFSPALVEYVVGRAELQDDEHFNSGRASALLERFTASVKALGI